MAQIVPMTSQEPIEQAEGELAEVKGLVDEQYGLVMRLKRIGADTHEAVRLLIDLLELQQTREQRLAQAQIHDRQRNRRFALPQIRRVSSHVSKLACWSLPSDVVSHAAVVDLPCFAQTTAARLPC